MRIEAGVCAGSGKVLVQREQLVQQSRSAAPVPDEEERRPEIEPIQDAPVHSRLDRPERGEHARAQPEAQFETAIDRLRMAQANTAPCGEIQIEYRPRPGGRTHGMPDGSLLSALTKRR